MKDFNFFDTYAGSRKDFKKGYLYGAILSTCLVILVIFMCVFNYFNISKLNSEIVDIQQNLNSKDNIDKLKEIENEEKKLAIMNKYSGMVVNINTGINNNDFVGSKVIDKINACVPEGVYFKSMALDATGMQLEAEGKDRETIAVFERSLRSLDIVKEVHIATINSSSTETENLTFSLNCTLKDVDNYEDN
ncbi:PilN domain-containing protein [Clostridium sp. CF012]|uniref:PilN domain-containing protein n=1 Tax=Clostridium sp. CF012 TaxID=2843319 RepID=UPI001C0B7EB8|nr:PilN domain-containing protein [Clostridium sp. CF012]MBU3144900.1 PilN domain-containing protein [Clostridium sp. CF012]